MINIILYGIGQTTALNCLLHLKLKDNWTVQDSLKNYGFMTLLYTPSSTLWIKITNNWKMKIFTEFTTIQK